MTRTLAIFVMWYYAIRSLAGTLIWWKLVPMAVGQFHRALEMSTRCLLRRPQHPTLTDISTLLSALVIFLFTSALILSMRVHHRQATLMSLTITVHQVAQTRECSSTTCAQ